LSEGYSCHHFDGINRYYLRREDEHLAGQLSVPVNVLDFYAPIREVQLEQELQRMRAVLGGPTMSTLPAQ
jgi:hypothetical protein